MKKEKVSIYVVKKVKGKSVTVMSVHSTLVKACTRIRKLQPNINDGNFYSVITYELDK